MEQRPHPAAMIHLVDALQENSPYAFNIMGDALRAIAKRAEEGPLPLEDIADILRAEKQKWHVEGTPLYGPNHWPKRDRIAFAEKVFVAGCESAGEEVSNDHAQQRWQQSYVKMDLENECYE